MALADIPAPCLQLSETVFCMGCHPRVGTREVTKICPKLCSAWYNACAQEFFSTQGINVPPSPCLDDSVVCAQLSSFVKDGEEMCNLYGYEVDHSTMDDTGAECYDGTIDPLEFGLEEPRVERGMDIVIQMIQKILRAQPIMIVIISFVVGTLALLRMSFK
mmetsp:Transcript_8127/g.10278  ORF Transcript_8127/g.10278 Transcript_8127/m.10278 type:complete len:161 (+) Transcript_8127:287-769(+)|eukprot:CAMPEP_0204841766 /NCGR_PEP_ID=MMETSP1346-20131115/43560_1 /ASSEMBLY_ACC=CAM_ASM_000771 /TAXON_ID=215587 /ORGANISM="Aplanochytrium stocchinoi, Strain GSBS06" /LENGTH=160 /DNA_ID=CAMNT_0051980155 /DNA_START=606 /DNA_END=1088 /DNA_ORIENTATION=-